MTAPIYTWQQPLWQSFQQALMLQRLPHAVLIHGLPGIGKQYFAAQMAQAILCEASAAQACGSCRSCHLWTVGHHPDFYRLHPEEAGKAIKIDAVRDSLEWLGLSPQQGRAKVLLLAPAERLNHAASNALLKSLEEPTPNTMLILVAEQPASLLATLRSRCQLWRMPEPTSEQSHAWLSQQGIDVSTPIDWQCQGPLAIAAMADTLAQQQSFYTELQAFVAGRLSVWKFSHSLQKRPIAEVFTALQQQWQQAATLAVMQQELEAARQYLQQYDLIADLKSLYERGANLNWPLQWDALLCQLQIKAP